MFIDIVLGGTILLFCALWDSEKRAREVIERRREADAERRHLELLASLSALLATKPGQLPGMPLLGDIAADVRLLRKLAYDEGDALSAHEEQLTDRAMDRDHNYKHPPANLRI